MAEANGGLRILLADFHALVRAAIRGVLQEMDGVEVVAEANNGREAIDLVARYRSQLVLMEIAMPHLNGWKQPDRLSRNTPTRASS
jgi:DNA-binding NarL/FixJ family response regulator